jgi:putative restriction endonuclease
MKGSTAFQGLRRAIGDRRWGALFTNQPPITQKELEHAAAALHATVITPFELTKAIRRADTVHQRIIRDVAFATIVRAEYKYTCCISGIKIATPAAFYEVEASHVVPVADGGTDDPRNGIALSRSLHWAFDRGLFGIMPDRRVYIPQQVRSQENRFLNALAGRRIKEATNPQYRVHDDALAWHLERYVRQWE